MPSQEEAAYTVASLLNDAYRLKDQQFLLIHGTGDANVHFQHTAELLNHLMLADANTTTQIYPDEGHFFQLEKNWRHLHNTVVSYFQKCFQSSKRLDSSSSSHEEDS
ncbi:inactive dipeptidyl peptidase 10-like [Rhinatrema bivittatum]|uniref:inactive dipeptidyl peptidase 10-like n=1 Tax=Rhinatrema bivittatum TaxID=194408 RepID=UPI00112EC5A2|nr:inactive dipeptidyl peptidase 10-like [Rhinatrema bivittatum]